MMTSASPMAISRSRVQTRISVRKECAVGDPEDNEAAGVRSAGAGPSGTSVRRGFFSSALSIFGCLVFIAWASHAAPYFDDGVAPSAPVGPGWYLVVRLDSRVARSVAPPMHRSLKP